MLWNVSRALFKIFKQNNYLIIEKSNISLLNLFKTQLFIKLIFVSLAKQCSLTKGHYYHYYYDLYHFITYPYIRSFLKYWHKECNFIIHP